LLSFSTPSSRLLAELLRWLASRITLGKLLGELRYRGIALGQLALLLQDLLVQAQEHAVPIGEALGFQDFKLHGSGTDGLLHVVSWF
jgi:hypothetical protein